MAISCIHAILVLDKVQVHWDLTAGSFFTCFAQEGIGNRWCNMQRRAEGTAQSLDRSEATAIGTQCMRANEGVDESTSCLVPIRNTGGIASIDLDRSRPDGACSHNSIDLV